MEGLILRTFGTLCSVSSTQNFPLCNWFHAAINRPPAIIIAMTSIRRGECGEDADLFSRASERTQTRRLSRVQVNRTGLAVVLQ